MDFVKTMKKINRTLSIVLAITIVFSVIVSISNVAAQEGDPVGDPEDGDRLRNCLAEDTGVCLRDTERNGALETPRDRDCDGDPVGDPLRTRGGDPIDAEI